MLLHMLQQWPQQKQHIMNINVLLKLPQVQQQQQQHLQQKKHILMPLLSCLEE